ncbi:EamA family transporter [Anaerosphaera aminiphila]|uniref:EamA family transporter n=1 Tax=Anaerosphaera aminiphila TaxID=1120994 RepID=UPI000934EF9C|nr:EamA family transporter [Anaerosphaera aminiphila]
MGQKYVTTVISSLILSFESIISVISGALIFHEVLSGREIIGCVLIFLAIILAQLPDILRNRI